MSKRGSKNVRMRGSEFPLKRGCKAIKFKAKVTKSQVEGSKEEKEEKTSFSSLREFEPRATQPQVKMTERFSFPDSSFLCLWRILEKEARHHRMKERRGKGQEGKSGNFNLCKMYTKNQAINCFKDQF